MVLVILQVVLPLIALVMKIWNVNLSRLIFVGALLVFLHSLLVDFQGFFPPDSAGMFFYMGNVVGMFEVALVAFAQSLWYKVLLSSSALLLKMITLPEGYSETITNILGIVITTLFIVISFIYQEVLNRRIYRQSYESQEKIKKFQNLLSDDFPISVLIATADFNTILYSNSFFKQRFQCKAEDAMNLDMLFAQFELEIDPESMILPDSSANNLLTLLDFVKSLSMEQIVIHDKNLIMLSATFKDSQSSNAGRTLQHYEVKIRRITWDGLASYAVILNDVSERHLVTALKLADEQKDRVIATVSHELRTPIHGTLGLLEMIAERTSDEVCQQYLKYCKSCNKLLLYLVNSILDLSQWRHNTLCIQKQTLILDELLEELRSLYIFQCQDKGIDFIIEKDPLIPREIYTDRHKLIEILINLVSNAVKFTFKGSVTLRIVIDAEDREKLRFTVTDTGIGVKDEDKSTLFRMFGKIQQEDKNINLHGVGLGLAIVKELVVAMNDNDAKEKIYFQSVYKKGSTFSFRLKHKSDKLISLATGNDSDDSEIALNSDFFREYRLRGDFPSHKVSTYGSMAMDYTSNASTKVPLFNNSRRTSAAQSIKLKDIELKDVDYGIHNVLVVDDNPLNILAVSFILGKMKLQFEKAFNGQECIEELMKKKKENKYYDLILMDIQMPILDGPQASKVIKDKIEAGDLPNIPIIALTAKTSTEEEKAYYESCGIQAVLEKPLNEDKLLEAIKTHINATLHS